MVWMNGETWLHPPISVLLVQGYAAAAWHEYEYNHNCRPISEQKPLSVSPSFLEYLGLDHCKTQQMVGMFHISILPWLLYPLLIRETICVYQGAVPRTLFERVPASSSTASLMVRECAISHAYRRARILKNSKSHYSKQTSFTAYIATHPRYFSFLYA